MDYYCSKCLVNKVAREGDVCAACRSGSQDPAPWNPPPDPPKIHFTPRRQIQDPAPQPPQPPVVPPANDGGAGGEAEASGSVRRGGQDSRSGIIQNFSAGPDERNFIQRVMDSLLTGISYNGRDNLFMTEFQLYENWNAGYGAGSASPQATRVVYYGKIAQGRPVENNDVTVYGVFDRKNNYFIAERIMNLTDGTYANFMPRKTPAALVRVVTAALLLAIVLLGFTLFAGGSGMSGGTGPVFSGTDGGFQKILLGLVTTAAGVGLIVLSRARGRLSVIGIGVLLALLGIFIMTVQNLEGKLSLLKTEIISVVVMAIILRVAVSLLLGAVSRPNPTVDRILNWVTVILVVLTIGSAALTIFLA